LKIVDLCSKAQKKGKFAEVVEVDER